MWEIPEHFDLQEHVLLEVCWATDQGQHRNRREWSKGPYLLMGSEALKPTQQVLQAFDDESIDELCSFLRYSGQGTVAAPGSQVCLSRKSSFHAKHRQNSEGALRDFQLLQWYLVMQGSLDATLLQSCVWLTKDLKCSWRCPEGFA